MPFRSPRAPEPRIPAFRYALDVDGTANGYALAGDAANQAGFTQGTWCWWQKFNVDQNQYAWTKLDYSSQTSYAFNTSYLDLGDPAGSTCVGFWVTRAVADVGACSFLSDGYGGAGRAGVWEFHVRRYDDAAAGLARGKCSINCNDIVMKQYGGPAMGAGAVPDSTADMIFGSRRIAGVIQASWNGRLASPVFYPRILTAAEERALLMGHPVSGGTSAWDFATANDLLDANNLTLGAGASLVADSLVVHGFRFVHSLGTSLVVGVDGGGGLMRGSYRAGMTNAMWDQLRIALIGVGTQQSAGGSTCTHDGFSGSTAAGILAACAASAATGRDSAILWTGTNDLNAGGTLAQLEADISADIAAIGLPCSVLDPGWVIGDTGADLVHCVYTPGAGYNKLAAALTPELLMRNRGRTILITLPYRNDSAPSGVQLRLDINAWMNASFPAA